jgi:hypothetical protein
LKWHSNILLWLMNLVHFSSYGKSFTVQAALLWNALPISARKSQSLDTFKKTGTNITCYHSVFLILLLFIPSFIFFVSRSNYCLCFWLLVIICNIFNWIAFHTLLLPYTYFFLTFLSIQRLSGSDRSIAIRPPIVHL